jgi:hypothetical protein
MEVKSTVKESALPSNGVIFISSIALYGAADIFAIERILNAPTMDFSIVI